MAYSTETDFLKRVSKTDLDLLTAPVSGDNLTADEILEEAIDTADGLINSYLAPVSQALPLATVPKTITQASCDIAIYNLHSRIQNIDIPEWVSSRYRSVIYWLKDLSSGKAILEAGAIDPADDISGTESGSERQAIFHSRTI